jgi:hypothetical protein
MRDKDQLSGSNLSEVQRFRRSAMSGAVLKVIAIFAVIELLVVGGLGALAASRLGFPYAALSPFAFAVYGLAGYFARRVGGSGAFAGATVALLDSVAWATFGGFGPQPTVPDLTASAKIGTVAFVTVSGAVCGLVGGWLWTRLRRV